ERHAPDLVGEEPRRRVQRLETGVLHFVIPAHLFDEQQRVRLDVKFGVAVRLRPAQRSEQAVVLGDVVRRHAERAVEFVEDAAVGVADDDAVARGPGVATRPAVDIYGQGLRPRTSYTLLGPRSARVAHALSLVRVVGHEAWVVADTDTK